MPREEPALFSLRETARAALQGDRARLDFVRVARGI